MHTPGPWKDFRADRSDFGRQVCAENGRIVVCEMISKGNAAANARLIAAAPELLAACESLIIFADYNRSVNLTGDLGKAVMQARAAIAKATGE